MGISLAFAVISAFGLAGLLSLKYIELEKGGSFAFSRFVSKGDKYIANFGRKSKEAGKRTASHIKSFATNHLPHHSKRVHGAVKASVAQTFVKARKIVRGSSALKNKGSVSVFLRSISSKEEE